MANPINTTQAARLIEKATGRSCSRQNLEKHLGRGVLMNSHCVLQRNPWRVDAETVVDEFLAHVSPFQAEAIQPTSKKTRVANVVPMTRPSSGSHDLPHYNESRARAEFEKANLLELERKEKEGELLRRVDYEMAYAQAFNITKTRLLGVPSTAKQRIPHLEIEEVDLLTTLIREALDELAAGEVKA